MMASQSTLSEQSQYLGFHIAGEEYAIGILRVREILEYDTVTRVPTTPRSIRGVINLRGSVVPVVDLAVKLGLAESVVTKRSCVVVVEMVLEGERTVMGLLADAVTQVFDLPASEIEPPPPCATRIRVECLLGMDRAPCHKSALGVRGGYITLTGGAAALSSFRTTPAAAAPQTPTVSGRALPADLKAGTSLDGSLTIRMKYAFAQVSFDKLGPAGKGAWIRLGQQQTPYVVFMEGIYRYRFQGTVFAERQGLLSSSDVGVSGHYDLPHGYGDVHAGIYNGETYTKAEGNGQKAFQVRGSLRPRPSHALPKGLRLPVFFGRDAPVARAS